MQEVFVVGDQPVPGYTLLENIGGSAFYRIWKVKDPHGQTKMWKEIDLVVGNAAVETRTLSLLVELRHPYLNTLTNFWQLNDGKTLVIETEVPVESVKDRLDRLKGKSDGLPIEEIHRFMSNAAEGLDFLNKPQHQFQGETVAIYHRALRPECLLLFEEPGGLVCKVSDFGLAKPVTEQTAGHSQGLMHYDYDPPEFFEGQTAPTSDQYALAINYYQMRTGSLPFSGTMLEQLQARLNDNPELSLIPEAEQSALRRALARDPRQRFVSCKELADCLREADQGKALPYGAPAPSREQPPVRKTIPSAPPPLKTTTPQPSAMSSSSRPASAMEQTSKDERQQSPEVVFHRRPEESESPAPQASTPEPASQAQRPASPTDLRSFRQQLSEPSAQQKSPVPSYDESDGKIPVYWVVLILLAFAGIAAYFLSVSAEMGG